MLKYYNCKEDKKGGGSERTTSSISNKQRNKIKVKTKETLIASPEYFACNAPLSIFYNHCSLLYVQ